MYQVEIMPMSAHYLLSAFGWLTDLDIFEMSPGDEGGKSISQNKMIDYICYMLTFS